MFPQKSEGRKQLPITEGVLDYFPDAIAYVAFVSKVGNDKHNPGEKMHWARGKSDDHANCVARHLIERGTYDSEGLLNEGTMAWRALACLQLRLEELAAQGVNIWELHPHGAAVRIRTQTPKKAWIEPTGEHGTATVTIDEHAHGDDHHVRDAESA
jgi:hypothetical protein